MPTKKVKHRITQGADYVYTGSFPKDCKGHWYRVIRFVKAVPSYQDQVLVTPLTGPDKGNWFVCSFDNFIVRYRPLTEEDRKNGPPKVAAPAVPATH